jgi:hypothetical protein
MYDLIEAESDSVKTLMDEPLHARINQYGGALETPFEKAEIYNVIGAGVRGKTPG